jgi:hypothetical protein
MLATRSRATVEEAAMHDTPAVVRFSVGALLALTAFAAAAQNGPLTTENIGRDPGAIRQDAERQRSSDMQQQQQRSQDQANQQYNDIVRQNQSRAAADLAQHQAERRSWQQRPPLAADHNPLLGRWESLGAGQRRGTAPGLSPEMAQLTNALIGNVTSGVCDQMLGRGTIEFRPNGVVAIGRDGRERPMYGAEYRGGGSRVVVLPQQGAAMLYMMIDFNGNDHATVATVGCGLSRSGPPMAKAALTNTAAAAAETGPPVQWKLIGHIVANGGFDIYLAPASVRRSGDLARMLGLFDFDKQQTFEGKAFHSARNEYEYDCARQRQRMVGTTGYSERMGKGVVVGTSHDVLPWQAVGANGPAYEHWKVACSKA